MKTKTLFVVAGIVLFLVGLMLLIPRATFKKLGKKLKKLKTKTYVAVIDKERLDEDSHIDRLYDKFSEIEKQLREHFGECYISISEKEIKITINVNNTEISSDEICHDIHAVISDCTGYYNYISYISF